MLTATELTSKKEYNDVTLISINTPIGIAHQVVSDGVEVAVLYNASVAFIREGTFIITGYVKVSADDSILSRQKWMFKLLNKDCKTQSSIHDNFVLNKALCSRVN